MQRELGRKVINELKNDKNTPIEFLDLHLTEITLYNCWGSAPKVELAQFFVLNASVLKLMMFDVKLGQGDTWFASQRRVLKLSHKASAEAEFHFQDIGMNVISHVNFIHDFSMPDPFAKAMG